MRQVTVRPKTLFITEASAKESIHAGVELVGCDLRVCSKIYPPAPDRVVNPGIPEHRISLHIANQDYLGDFQGIKSPKSIIIIIVRG
ncbi:hypothetical protein, partial [Brasilonema bromeliae]|uniref:hypothetical protein n=1 Tax=Brasilonema bromeliae TaxID=383615 RepID=UPI00145F509D